MAITYGIQPYGDTPPAGRTRGCSAGIIGGIVLLVVFVLIEQRVAHPMVSIGLFRIRAFALGNLAGLLASIGRGGLQFMLIIWLQGIWLPLHGYSLRVDPAVGRHLPAAADRRLPGRRTALGLPLRPVRRARFATGGLLIVAATFVLLLVIPVDFSYWQFAAILALNGIGSGLFSAPNTTAIMNAVPAHERGAASGIRGTVFNSGSALSIGVFFSLMIVGLARVLPDTLFKGLTGQGVPADAAHQVAGLPPVGSLFASFLGYNPIQSLLEPTGALDKVPGAQSATLTGKEFFPNLMSGPFHQGLVIVFTAAAVMTVIGAIASWAAGGKYVHEEPVPDPTGAPGADLDGTETSPEPVASTAGGSETARAGNRSGPS